MIDFTGATWRKASASNDTGNCVEVARVERAVGVRDSKDRGGPVLTFTTSAWTTFTESVRRGEF